MPKLVYSSETRGCGATIQLDNDDICMISIARTGVLVRTYRPGFINRVIGSLWGATLFNETNLYKCAMTARVLMEQIPENIPALNFKNPVLSAFAHVVWSCSSAGEVAVRLNDAFYDGGRASPQPGEAPQQPLKANERRLHDARNWPPKRPPERTPAPYRVIYSDDVSQEWDLTPAEIDRWAAGSNRDFEEKGKDYRIKRIIDAQGTVVWPKVLEPKGRAAN